MAKVTAGKVVGLVIGSMLAVCAGIWGSTDFLKAPDPRSYASASGEVLRVWVDISKSNRNTCAEYEYTVANKKYRSKMNSYNENTFPFDMIPGQPLIVYYQPNDPDVAVLDRKRPTQKMFTALMLVGLLSFGTIVAVFAPDPPWVRKRVN